MSDTKNDPGFQPRMSDQRRAFLLYKENTKKYGKPFMPNGVWHDVIAATIVMLVIIGLSCAWFAEANCDSYWNPTCNRVSTPLEQQQFTPKEPGVVVKDKKGKVDESVKRPYFGLLYEEKADPSTTSYHPRPEWYFFFLFYLLILFANPQLVVLGTIGVPTLWLIILIALPFIDRRRERRPSRRPIAMTLMVLVSIMLLSFTYLGSQSGKHKSGPSGLTASQMAMPGYQALFVDGLFETCQSCHQLGGVGNGGPGPNLSAVGTRYKGPDDFINILAHGKGGVMPIKGGTSMTNEQGAQIAAFLSTLGVPAKADDATVLAYSQKDWDRVTGGGSQGATGSTGNTDASVAQSDQNATRAPVGGEVGTGA